MLKNNSNYWLVPPKGEDISMIEMANMQSAISNFVRILTKKDIPVEYIAHNNGDSMTDGKNITISSKINTSNIDSVVGLALHEGSHCSLTNFNFIKKIGNYLAEKNLLGHKHIIYFLHNFVEDRRIDSFIYKNAPGYQGYYNAMYNRYFYHKNIDKGLKSSKFRKENWESYMFRIANIFNKNTDLNALAKLKEVYNIIDLKNIDRLKSTKDTFEIAIKIYKVINSYISNISEEQTQKQNQKNKKNSNSKEKIEKEKIKKSFKLQENFINGKTPKSKTTKYIKELVDIAQKHKLKNKFSTFTNPEGVMLKQRVTIIPNITNNLINNNFMGLFTKGINPHNNKEFLEKGLIKGKKLLKQLKVRNEEQRLETNHLKKGKLDSKRLYAANYTNNIFKKIDIKTYKKINIHLSIDGSGSMKGNKWNSVLENTTAIAYVATKLNNINLKISIRTTAKDPLLKSKRESSLVPILIIAFDSTKHNFNHINKLKNFKVDGLTPEGICLEALNNFIEPSSYYLDSYLINMSDGMPTFTTTTGDHYKGEKAVKDTARVINLISKKRVNIMSYFIQDKYNNYRKEAENKFKLMYGRNAKFVDVNNINIITKTLNELFLKKDLIS